MKFGDNLRKLRKMKNLSQEDLAERMNVSRQSVSKWETGDAYPEINNILELCKIFHCHINDLVNDSIIDADSLDEDVKMNVVKFKQDQQSKMKGLSNAIAIISKIGKIISIVCIPIIIITMITLGVIVSKTSIENNEIRFEGSSDVIKIVENEDKLTVKMNDLIVADITDSENISKVKEILNDNSRYAILGYVEIGLAFLIVNLALASIIFKSLEKLFDNIHNGDTPFTLENVGHIKRVAYLMIAITIIPNIVGALFEVIFKNDFGVGFEMFNLVEILFLFSIAYIFQYGYEIQLDSKGKMYGDINE